MNLALLLIGISSIGDVNHTIINYVRDMNAMCKSGSTNKVAIGFDRLYLIKSLSSTLERCLSEFSKV